MGFFSGAFSKFLTRSLTVSRLSLSRLTISRMLLKSNDLMILLSPLLSLKTGCSPWMPESRTAQVILLQFTLNRVRAASPLTDGTDFSSAGNAFRFNETCQIFDATFALPRFGVRIGL